MGAIKVNNLLIKYKPDFMVRFCYANSNIFLKKIVRKQQKVTKRCKCASLFSICRQGKSALEKLKQFSITLAKPSSLNSVSNSTNKLHFQCQTVKTIPKE